MVYWSQDSMYFAWSWTKLNFGNPDLKKCTLKTQLLISNQFILNGSNLLPIPHLLQLNQMIFFIVLLGQLSFLTVKEYLCTKDEWCTHCVGRVYAKQASVCARSAAITGWKRQDYKHRHFHFFLLSNLLVFQEYF